MPGSLQGYRTSLLAGLGNEEAKQSLEKEKPGFNMFGSNTSSKISSFDSDKQQREALNKEVEIGLGSRIDDVMTDTEKQRYLNHLTDEQYQQMLNYKNEGYGFMASKTLLENSYKLADPSATGLMKYKDFAGKEAHYANSLLTPDEAVTTPTQQLADRWNERYSKNVQYGTNERGETYVIRDDNNFWNRLANVSFGSLINLFNTGTQGMMNIMDKGQSALWSALDKAILGYETDPDFYRQSDTTLINDVAQAVGSASSLALLGAGVTGSPLGMAGITTLSATKPGEAVLDLTYGNLNKLVNRTLDKVDFMDYLNTQSLDSLSNAITLGISVGLAKYGGPKIQSSKIGGYANTIKGMVKNGIQKSVDYAKVQADYENFSKVKGWKSRGDDTLVETESYQPGYRGRIAKAGWEGFWEGVKEKVNQSNSNNIKPYEGVSESTVEVTDETTPVDKIKKSVGTSMLERWNRMGDSDANNFNKNYGTSYSTWLANRGFNKSYENNISDLIQYEKQIGQQEETALREIQQRYNDPSVDDMLNESIKKAKNLRSDDLTKLDSLSLKNQQGGLSPSDIYWLSEWYGENLPLDTSLKNMNIFNKVDRFLEKISNENGLSQYRDLTNERNATRDIIKNITKYYNKIDGSGMSFGDWVDVATFLMNPKSRPGILLKQTLKNPKIKDVILEKLIEGKKPEERNQIKIDLNKIRKLQDEIKQKEAFEERQKKWNIVIEDAAKRVSNRLPEQTQGGVVAGDKGFVTSNGPTYEELGLGKIKEINKNPSNELLKAILQQLKEGNKGKELAEESMEWILQKLSPESQQKITEIGKKIKEGKILTNREKRIIEKIGDFLSKDDLPGFIKEDFLDQITWNIERNEFAGLSPNPLKNRKTSKEVWEKLVRQGYINAKTDYPFETLEDLLNWEVPYYNMKYKDLLDKLGYDVDYSTVSPKPGYLGAADLINNTLELYGDIKYLHRYVATHELGHVMVGDLSTVEYLDLMEGLSKATKDLKKYDKDKSITEYKSLAKSELGATEFVADQLGLLLSYMDINGVGDYLQPYLSPDLGSKVKKILNEKGKDLWDAFSTVEVNGKPFTPREELKKIADKSIKDEGFKNRKQNDILRTYNEGIGYENRLSELRKVDPRIQEYNVDLDMDSPTFGRFLLEISDGNQTKRITWEEYKKQYPEETKSLREEKLELPRVVDRREIFNDKPGFWSDESNPLNQYKEEIRSVNPDVVGLKEKDGQIYVQYMIDSNIERWELPNRPGYVELKEVPAMDYFTEEEFNKLPEDLQKILEKDEGLYQGGDGGLQYSEGKNLKLGNGFYFGSKKQAKEFGPSIIRLEKGDRKFYEPKDTQTYQVEASQNGGKEAFNKKLQEEGYDGIKAYNQAFKDYEYNFFTNPFLKNAN